MKKITLLTTIILTIAVSVWCLDVYSDRTKQVIIKTPVSVYDNWECGHFCEVKGVKVFSLNPEQTLDVLSVRYGKDFMAIKVEQGSRTGWIISSSRQVELIDKDS